MFIAFPNRARLIFCSSFFRRMFRAELRSRAKISGLHRILLASSPRVTSRIGWLQFSMPQWFPMAQARVPWKKPGPGQGHLSSLGARFRPMCAFPTPWRHCRLISSPKKRDVPTLHINCCHFTGKIREKVLFMVVLLFWVMKNVDTRNRFMRYSRK